MRFPVRATATKLSIRERASAQSPLRRWSMPAVKWAKPMVNACWLGSARRGAPAFYFGASPEPAGPAGGLDQQDPAPTPGGETKPEIFLNPSAREPGRVAGGQFNHPIILTPEVIHLHEIARGEDTKSQVPEAPRDLQRAGAGHERLVELTEQRVGHRHERINPAAPTVVVQPLGNGFGLAQALQHPLAFAELAQHQTQLETELEALLQRGLALRQRLEDVQRLLERFGSLEVGRSRARKPTRLEPVA